ncbi:hypothetical protein Clacol_004964 [Clathrus columnatus]|uniref:Uncharacterized protein n=1 Tax=Clathrus columnatus TaxID=1419009 RepID=A0AAV5AAY4_9AGAM|nr:hypothetical protein Clacol_004964 [Clathrus columnatus]
MPSRIRSQSPPDPFTIASQPPPDETPEEKAIREGMSFFSKEQEALRISNAIDESLKAERAAEKRKKVTRLLLLGQSESGKSTTLRQFQLHYTPNAFRTERLLWRSIVQLNVVRSILTVLDTLSEAQSESLQAIQSSNVENSDAASDDPLFFSDDFEILKSRLDPLRRVEEILIAKLGDEEAPVGGGSNGGGGAGNNIAYSPGGGIPRPGLQQKKRKQEVTVRSTAMEKLRVKLLGGPGGARPQSEGEGADWDEPTEVIYHCREEMMALWEDPTVREVLRRRRVRVEEGPGFFLDELERVTSAGYVPSDDDILRARLKTVGVTEYRFDMEASAGRESGSEWRIYDVGGSRSQEDHSVNRLEDSVLLWKSICSNKLLANCDILASKLEAGIRLSKYVRSFGERSNDVETASAYFKSKFQAIEREYSPNLRRFYGYATSVTDRETTGGILHSGK